MILALTACAPNVGSQAANGGLLTTEDLVDSTQIFGGDAVDVDDAVAASTVAIVNLRYGQVVCTASLVSRNLVLTAGHCTTVDPTHLAILFSNKIPKNRDEASKIPMLKVVAGVTHPLWPKNDFKTGKNWGDIALLRFEGDVPANFKPVRLLSNKNRLQSQAPATLAGFGWTNGPRKTAAEGLNKAIVKIEDPNFSETEILLNQKSGTGACHGDSGGPAFVEIQGQLVVFGVTSRGHDDPNDTCENYSVYSSVAAKMDWIKTAAIALQREEALGQKIPQPY